MTGLPKAPRVNPLPSPPLATTFSAYIDVEPSTATAVLSIDDGTVIHGQGHNHIDFLDIPSKLNQWGGNLHIEAPDYDAVDLRVGVTSPTLTRDDTKQPVQIQLVSSVVALAPLVRRNHFFMLATGEFWTCIQASQFNLLNRLASGEDIDPVLDLAAQVGVNELRVFAGGYRIDLIGDCPPRPELYQAIPVLSRKASRRNLRLELVLFTGPYVYFPDRAAFDAHAYAALDACTGLTNVSIERVNEGDNGPNIGAPLVTIAGRGLPWSNGSGNSDSVLDVPFGDYISWHAGGGLTGIQALATARQGKKAYELANDKDRPVKCNEWGRFPDSLHDIATAEDAAECAALFCVGSCIHTVEGKAGQPWTNSLPYVEAHVRGAKKVPLQFQDGTYFHADNLESPTIAKAYGKRLPSGDYIVQVRNNG